METKTYASTLEESAIVERVARIVSSVRGDKPDYTRVAAELGQAIPFDLFGVVLLRYDRQAVRVAICRREGNGWDVINQQHPLEGSKLETMLSNPTLVVANYPAGLDGSPANCGDALSGHHHLRATLIVPLMVEERLLGTLELGSTIPNIYAQETLQRLTNAVAHVLATAIESVQMGGSAAIQDRQRQALKDVTSAITAKIDLPTILNQIVTGIANTLNVASAIIMLNPRQERLHLEAQSGLEPWALEAVLADKNILSSTSIIGQTLRRQQPFVSQDIAIDERYPDSYLFYSKLAIHSIFCYPLVTGSTIYGALLLCSPEPGGFTPLKADILSLFASQATVAIHNGLLLESAHLRTRFQDAIAQLEERHRITTAKLPSNESMDAGANDDEKEDLRLLARVREESERTFGVSFTSLLRFISDHLLTQNERDLQALLYPEQGGNHNPWSEKLLTGSVQHKEPYGAVAGEELQPQLDRADTLSLLTQTAEEALLRTGMVGELSRLMMQSKQTTSGVEDAWFVVDLNGACIYMNPTAQALCQVRMEEMTSPYTQLFASHRDRATMLTIEGVFSRLFPRVRNESEVRAYLQDFGPGATHTANYRELRCVLSLEPIARHDSGGNHRGEAGSAAVTAASSDSHYQFIWHPLQNQAGQLLANVLQVCDVTAQVRDDQNRSALLSSVSHDLRTPLTTIKAAVTGLLQSDVAWSEVDRQAMLEDIDSETDHLTVLVNALVELSRIEMGALVLEREWCDITEVVDSAVAKAQRTLVGQQVRIECQRQLPPVFADFVQLERVFLNLIENAALHNPEQLDIIVRLTCDEECLHASVLDHRQGIPQHELGRVFTSYYNQRLYGNGLALAICKGIVEAHQGRIWVEAAQLDPPSHGNKAMAEAGVCFTFTLPINPYTVVHTGRETASPISRGKTGDDSYLLEQAQKPTQGGSNENEK